MAFVTADRVYDTSTSTGTGAIAVSGTAPTGYRTFSAVLSVNDTFYYSIQHQTLNEWEVGLGTYSSANTFARTTIYSSSNAGSAVTFSAGTKDVFITMAASRTPQLDASGNLTPSTGTYTRTTFTATAGQTSFTATYTVNYVQVYVNGILLNSADYTATTGTTVVLASAAAAGDIVDVIALNIGTFTGGVTITGTPASGQLTSWTGSSSVQGFAPSAVGDVPFSTDGTTFAATQKIVRGTSVSASGTAVDFTSIPSWVKKITIGFIGVSPNSTGSLLVQIYDNGTLATSGYSSVCSSIGTATVTSVGSTSGFLITNATANAAIFHGNFFLTNMGSAGIAANCIIGRTDAVGTYPSAGSYSAATITGVRITITGANIFDAGSINILYE
jgi:hypothetical protein